MPAWIGAIRPCATRSAQPQTAERSAKARFAATGDPAQARMEPRHVRPGQLRQFQMPNGRQDVQPQQPQSSATVRGFFCTEAYSAM